MKRSGKISALLLALMLVFSSSAVSFAGVSVKIDNSGVGFTNDSGAPFIDSADRTQVPFRVTLEAFGADVSWDPASRTASAFKDGVTVKVPIGRNYILKNGSRIPNDTAALIKDGRTYLPIRAVLEAFGAKVSWDQASQTVIVVTGSSNGRDPVSVHFIDVGQGDSTFIDCGDFEILIDAGTAQYGKKVASYIKGLVDGDLDVVIATHEHADHIGGLPAVINAFRVDKILDNGRSAKSRTYENYINSVRSSVEKNGTLYLRKDSAKNVSFFTDCGASLRTLPIEGTFKDPNNNSLISLLTYGSVSLLFTGDAEEPEERANLSKFSDVTLLKAGHHGSRTASCEQFLNIVRPEIVIVSAKSGNSYKHPHLAALQRFAKVGADVYGTFRSGNIVFTTDGNRYSINTSDRLTLNDAGDI